MGNKLGEFSLDNFADDVFFLQNGFYRFNGKWKQRGMGKLKGKEIDHLETFENDNKLYYKFKLKRNTRLRSGIIQNRLQDVGKIETITKLVNLNADRKRFWLDRLSGINNERYSESFPISLNLFSKNQI